MERVYHYTTMEAFLHLIESVKDSSDKKSFVFRATNIFFMNDPQEFTFGQCVLMKVLEEIENDKNVDRELRLSSLFEKYKGKSEEEWLGQIRETIHNHKESPYIISFSRNKDSLPMWLNYGDKGYGVCLAFAEYHNNSIDFQNKEIDQISIELFDSLGTFDVNYGYDIINNKENLIYKNLCYMHEYYLNKVKQIVSPKELSELQIGMLKGLSIVNAPYVKRKEYQGEKEVRLAKTIFSENMENASEIKFRCNMKGHIIPYISVEIPTKQLEYVMTGPLVNKDLSIRAIEMMKKKYDLNFDVKGSNINYRDY